MVGGGACALDTGLHSGEEAGALLAMALEVGEGRAAVAGEGSDEASQGARRDVVKLSRGNTGQSNDGGDSEGLHGELRFCGDLKST